MPTKSAWNGASGCQPGEEEPVLGADEADLDALVGEAELLAEEARVGLGVGDDDVGPAERMAVDARGRRPRRASPRRKRPRSSTSVS